MTKYINISSLRKPSPVTIVAEDGSRHAMVPATVEALLESVKDVESVGLQASTEQETELVIKGILRSFPTLDRTAVLSWDLQVMRQVYEMIIAANSEVVSKDEEVIEEAKQTGKSKRAE